MIVLFVITLIGGYTLLGFGDCVLVLMLLVDFLVGVFYVSLLLVICGIDCVTRMGCRPTMDCCVCLVWFCVLVVIVLRSF